MKVTGILIAAAALFVACIQQQNTSSVKEENNTQQIMEQIAQGKMVQNSSLDTLVAASKQNKAAVVIYKMDNCSACDKLAKSDMIMDLLAENKGSVAFMKSHGVDVRKPAQKDHKDWQKHLSDIDLRMFPTTVLYSHGYAVYKLTMRDSDEDYAKNLAIAKSLTPEQAKKAHVDFLAACKAEKDSRKKK